MTRFRLIALALLLIAAGSVVLRGPGASASTPSGSVASAPVPAPNGAAGKDITVTMTEGGLQRSYLLFVPNNLAPSARLVMFLHGFTLGPWAEESATQLDVGAGKAGVLVAYPAGYDASWNAGTCCGDAVTSNVDDVSFLADVINDIEARYSVDPLRIGLAGFSNGGMMAYRFACERSDLVNDIVVGSATSVTQEPCTNSRQVSVFAMHGLADPTVPYAGILTSKWDATGFPSVPATLAGVAARDGCTGTWRTQQLTPTVQSLTMTGCPADTTLMQRTAMWTVHTWKTGATAPPSFDETMLLWNAFGAMWAKQST
jgi:polyhydroxybutyrate depolymerase